MIDRSISYRAYLKAQAAAEYFLMAYAKEDDLYAAIRHDNGVEEVRELANRLGFKLAPVAASEQKDAA